MVKKADIPDHVIKTALTLAGEEGWSAVSLASVATAAKLPVAEVHRVIPDRQAILTGIGRLVDDAVLAEGSADPDDGPRDRLFDVMMRRFDLLQDHRAGILAVMEGLRREPLSALCQGPALERSMKLMLDLAGMSAKGLIGMAKVRVLALIYLDIVRVWRGDDTEDMAKTMKALDKRLEQAEQLANTFERGRPRRGRGRAEESNDASNTDPGQEEPSD
ncbi:MAG: hypothetical protein AAF414_02100 [Pseudomonadota bacterium]